MLSLVVGLVATPIARWAAYKYKIVDRPDDLLKPHGRPVAYLGGLGMLAGLLAGLTGLSYAELAVRFPEAAGAAAYVKEAFGSNRLSQLTGLAVAAMVVVSTASIARGSVGYVQVFLSWPAAAIADTTPCAACSLWCQFTATAAPCCARSFAVAAPMPRLAPVTSTTRFLIIAVSPGVARRRRGATRRA